MRSKSISTVFCLKRSAAGLLLLFSFIPVVFSQSTLALKYSEGLAPKKVSDKNTKGLYGFVNTKGKVVISPQYDTVYAPFKSGFASVGNNRKAGVIDKKGKVIIPFEFLEIGEISKSFIPVKSTSGLWGFYSQEGEKICDPMFQNFRYAGKNKIIVQKGSRWGMINHKADQLIPCEYQWIQQLSERNYKLVNTNSWSVRNKSNEVLFSVKYDTLKNAGEGMFKFSVIGKHGFMDAKGNIIAAPQYDEIGDFRNGLVKVRNDKYGVIDRKNKVFIPFEYDDIIIDSLYIRVKVQVKGEDGKVKERWGLYDLRGNKLVTPKYASMKACSEGMIAVGRDDGTWGYISPKGATEIIFRYSSADNFKNGLALVKVPYSLLKRDHPAIIDKEGEYVISPADYQNYTLGLIRIDRSGKASYIVPKDKYAWYQKVSERYLKVQVNGYYGILNTEGREVIPPVYDHVSDPSENGLFVVQKGGRYGVVDRTGKFTYKLSNRFEKVFGFSEGFAKVSLKGKYGFIDRHGDVYISAQYPAAGEMHDSMVNVIIREKWGFLDYHENLKVQPYYEEVKPFKNGVALAKEGGKWNIVNKQGKQLHQSHFDKIVETSGGNYMLFLQDKVGLADKRGREILAPKYEKIEEIGSALVKVKKNGLWGVLDYKENFILPIEFDKIDYNPALQIFITGNSGRQEDIIVK